MNVATSLPLIRLLVVNFIANVNMSSKTIALLLLAVLCISTELGQSFIIAPSELPLILQLIYTRIPPIRLGTDSKVGFGFRMGKNADYQVVFELGPQENRIDNNVKRSTVNKKKYL